MLTLINRLPIGWLLRLALLRLATQWRSLLTVMIGVLLAAVVGANMPLYTSAIAQVGMLQRLESQSTQDININTRISLSLTAFPDLLQGWDTVDRAATEQIDTAFSSTFPGWAARTIRYGESTAMFVTRDGVDFDSTRLRIGYYENYAQYVEVVAGTLPTDSADLAADLEIAMHVDTAAALNLAVNDVIVLDQRGWDTSRPIRARITATIRQLNPADSYWMTPSPLTIQQTGQAQLDTAVLTTRASLARIVTEFIPQTFIQAGWRVLFDHVALPFSSIPQALAQLGSLDNNLREALQATSTERLSFVYQTRLSAVLEGYGGEVTVLGAPFGLLLLQLGALVLFFLVATAALVRRNERREIALLQSRGAYDRQLLLLRGIEALLIAVVAALLAPALSRQLLVWLVPLFTGISSLPLQIDTSAYFYAGGAALLALIVLITTLFPVLQLPLILAGGSAGRSDTQPWWQKLYLDVVVLIVGVAALARLTTSDSLLVQTQIGSTQADPLLLVAPTLLFIGLGSLSLRLFPPLMRFLALAFARRGGVEPVLAGWQVSREPLHYGRITFLLALAVGIGWFAITFQSTMSRSQQDQARYRVGTDVRMLYPPGTTANTVENYPQAQASTVVLRFDNINMSTDSLNLLPGTMLAVDSAAFPPATYWRDDLGTLQTPGPQTPLPQTGRTLPGSPDTLRLWAHYTGANLQGFNNFTDPVPSPDAFYTTLLLMLRLRDDSGRIIYTGLTPVIPQEAYTSAGDFPNWVQLQAQLSTLDPPPVGSLRLEGIVISGLPLGFNSQFFINSVFAFTGLELLTADQPPTALDWFTGEGWSFVNERAVLLDSAAGMGITEAPTPAPQPQALTFTWRQTSGNLTPAFGLLLDYPERVTVENARSEGFVVPEAEIIGMPVLVSEQFAAINRLNIGQQFPLFVNPQTLWFEVAGIVPYYPTLYDNVAPFMVVDHQLFSYTLERRPFYEPAGAITEQWLRLPSTASAADITPAVPGASAITIASVLDGLQTDLLALGLIGLLFLSFLIGLVLSVVSLFTYLSLAVQSRRSELAVLRALGLAPWRIILSIAIEQLFVMLTALALGAVIGTILSSQVLPTLSISTTGASLVPPFIVQADGGALLQYALLLAGLLLFILLGGALLLRRMTHINALRLIEE